MDYNLLSIVTLEGCYATIKEGRFDIIDSEEDEVMLSGTRVGKSCLLDLKYAHPPQALRSSKKPQANYASWDEWHRRLGHLGMQNVEKLSQIATGIDAGMADQLQQTLTPHKLCEECTMGKMANTKWLLTDSPKHWTESKFLFLDYLATATVVYTHGECIENCLVSTVFIKISACE